MRKSRAYNILSALVLLGFVYMMGAKSLHHHEAVVPHHIVCVLDGEICDPFTEHEHTSVVPQLQQQEDDCLICQFAVSKLRQVAFCPAILPPVIHEQVYEAPSLFLSSKYFAARLSRAPPVA